VRTDELSVWVYDELVFEEFRGKGIQQKILFEMFKQYKNIGYKRVYVGILADNEPSLKAHKRFGFKKLVKEIKMLKILGIKRHKVIVHWKVDDE
jgi:L-amino acid N-acyltransferase YncA